MKNIIQQLANIPPEATTATIHGVKMQIIDNNKWQEIRRSDPEQKKYSECLMANGIFIIAKQNGLLHTLYKVKNSPTEETFQKFNHN